MRFKLEVCLLTAAIALFVLSSVFYSYQVDNSSTQNMYVSSLSEVAQATAVPYQTFAISSMGFGSILMIIASVSYQKRSKELEVVN